MINSDQIHVAMTKMSGRVATLDCQSNIFIENEYESEKGLCIARVLTKRMCSWTASIVSGKICV